MLKLIKYLKPFWVLISIIILLLLFQANLDLMLPEYTSKIVNVGIQQNGIEYSVPEAMRKSTLDTLETMMSDSEFKEFNSYYQVVYPANQAMSKSKKSTQLKATKEQVKKYPLLEYQPIAILKKDKMEQADRYKYLVAKNLAANFNFEMELAKVQKAKYEDDLMKSMIISGIKQEKQSILTESLKKLDKLPESAIKQIGIQAVTSEYKAMKMNVDGLKWKYITINSMIMLLIAILSMMVVITVGYFSSKVAAGLGYNLREKSFKKVIDFSNSEVDKFSVPSLITRTTNDIQQVQTTMVMAIRILFYAPILAIGGFIKVLNGNMSMGWLIGVGVIALLIVVTTAFLIGLPKFKMIQKLIDKLNTVSREALSGMLVVRAFSTQKHEEEKFDRVNDDLTKTNIFVTRVMTMIMPLLMFISNVLVLLIVWLGADYINKGSMQVGDLLAFIQYSSQIIFAFITLSYLSIMLTRSLVCIERVHQVITTRVSIKNPKSPKVLPKQNEGMIEFKNVSFKYPHASEYVLHNISFVAKPGEMTAFIGSTGSGKSTLINLIPRFYDATEGAIFINGVNIKEIHQNVLRKQIGYIPQKGVLFSGSVRSNLKYGNPNATDEQLLKFAEIAQVGNFINKKEEGLDFSLSQEGSNVSGGQRQRLSIARALAKQSKIYIFDDSFSALDFKTDINLRRALNENMADATILVVAQRIGTIMNADKIIVLDEGEMVGMGTHKQLLQNCEIYSQIAYSQLSKEELE